MGKLRKIINGRRLNGGGVALPLARPVRTTARVESSGWSASVDAAVAELPRASAVETEFSQAVEAALEGGLLRYSKRLELRKLANELGLDRFEAALMIARIQYRSKTGRGVVFEESAPEMGRELTPGEVRTRKWLTFAAIFLMAAVMDLVLFRWIQGFGGPQF